MSKLSSLKYLLEKAKSGGSGKSKKPTPKQYHPDYLDLETWKNMIEYILKDVDDYILDDNTFDLSYANNLFDKLNNLPSLDGISEDQLVELNDYITEIFNLLVINSDASTVIANLQYVLKLIEKFKKDIPPPEEQVSIDNPDKPTEAGATATDTETGATEVGTGKESTETGEEVV